MLFSRVLRRHHASTPFLSIPKSKTWLFQGVRFRQSRNYAHAYKGPETTSQRIGENVVIFDAGVLRTTFVGLLKATTVVIFFGNLLVFSPSLYFYPTSDQPLWLPPAVAAAGSIPLLYVMWASAPFVVTAYLKNIPLSARRSTDHLLRWAERLPSNSAIEFKMFKWNGFFRRTIVPFSELRTKKPKLGIENLVRANGQKKEPKLFYVGNGRVQNVRAQLWQKISPQIRSLEAPKQ